MLTAIAAAGTGEAYGCEGALGLTRNEQQTATCDRIHFTICINAGIGAKSLRPSPTALSLVARLTRITNTAAYIRLRSMLQSVSPSNKFDYVSHFSILLYSATTAPTLLYRRSEYLERQHMVHSHAGLATVPHHARLIGTELGGNGISTRRWQNDIAGSCDRHRYNQGCLGTRRGRSAFSSHLAS